MSLNVFSDACDEEGNKLFFSLIMCCFRQVLYKQHKGNGELQEYVAEQCSVLNCEVISHQQLAVMIKLHHHTTIPPSTDDLGNMWR